jgi:excisionase family DNA binding protein
MNNSEIKFLNTKEVAEALGCSLPTARQIMMRYDFPLIRVGRAMKVEKNALLEWASHRHI